MPQPETEPSHGWHGTAWLAPETGGTWRSDWQTIMQFNRQQAALGRPQIVAYGEGAARGTVTFIDKSGGRTSFGGSGSQ